MTESKEDINLWVMCDSDDEESGPTQIVLLATDGDGSLPPDFIRMLEKSFPKEKFGDREKNEIIEPPARVIEVLQQNGFYLHNEAWFHGDKKVWCVANRAPEKKEDEGNDDED